MDRNDANILNGAHELLPAAFILGLTVSVTILILVYIYESEPKEPDIKPKNIDNEKIYEE